MKEFEGKGAVITGGGSGIGLGMARAFAEEGMNLVLADIEGPALEQARRQIADLGVEVSTYQIDVSARAEMNALADYASKKLGDIHILCNNAGVSQAGNLLDQVTDDHWDWMLGVNLHGVIYGLQAFLPLLKKHGQGGQIVNTASIGGLNVNPDYHYGPYSTTKFAIVGLSEALKYDMAPHNIGVSVLCPAAVATGIFESGRARPARFGGAFERKDGHPIKEMIAQGDDPHNIGRWVVKAIRDEVFYIVPHPETREWVEQRFRRILDGYDWAAQITEEKETSK